MARTVLLEYEIRHRAGLGVVRLRMADSVVQRATGGDVNVQQEICVDFCTHLLEQTGTDLEWVDFAQLIVSKVKPVDTVSVRRHRPAGICICECPGCDDQGWHCHKVDRGCER